MVVRVPVAAGGVGGGEGDRRVRGAAAFIAEQ